ncbi:Bifunctional transcriptional activator/DNA repair enzyme Ada [Oligella sp. MSHR50489EDL]|uniref:methylated-DNA--[protein]-cysteine S-methyltransferase n=1 Tax=Oligella sp. MSHR50489EDL TaxID=3139409 RepID=UPI003D8142B0
MTQSNTTTIRYSSAGTDIGFVLVATINEQIYVVLLDEDEETSLAALKMLIAGDYPHAELQKTPSDHALALIKDYISAPSNELYQQLQGLDLLVRGTDFQKQVWQVLKSIPVGQTLSYRELAQQIGAPAAVRAVANACGANRHAIIVPCHRVLRSDGSISGYRWGSVRKKQLLALESTYKESP